MESITLLELLCRKTRGECQGTIRFLIETNPDTLLLVRRRKAVIHYLPENGSIGALLLWITERYPWVFEHELC